MDTTDSAAAAVRETARAAAQAAAESLKDQAARRAEAVSVFKPVTVH